MPLNLALARQELAFTSETMVIGKHLFMRLRAF